MDFIVGQRWSSHSEPELGLGVISEIDDRQIIVSFPAVGENRAYSKQNPPISRIHYRLGDQLKTTEGEAFTVKQALEEAGLFAYVSIKEGETEEVVIPEWKLDGQVRFSTPLQRLISGQVDHNSDYRLRVATINQKDRVQRLPIQGLMGARTELLPHQIHIANEVAQRFAPRVMLADEVGLGKTIEAGMILHHQHQIGQVNRILIVVPDSLVHQWFVEMLRKFHLHFSIFDTERFNALKEEGHENPLEAEQLLIMTLSELKYNSQILEAANQVQWDLLVIDEAHHLHWAPDLVSQEYQIVESLSKNSKGLLLLTATPEQVGFESHFGRLKLLDPERYQSIDEFRKEYDGYLSLNQLLQTLLTHSEPEVEENQNLLSKAVEQLTDEQQTELTERLPNWKSEFDNKEALIKALLDRFGTGRAMFRNTRSALKGFPGRAVTGYPLDQSEQYQSLSGQELHTPETHFPEEWLSFDARVEWLQGLIKSLKPAKILVICHKAETAKSLDKHFNLYAGVRSTAFYEGLSLVERDRAAAYFADEEMGARVLICSEIGSEGRNFQFVHHLVLFDLPTNPDLIEQRIGRLDRIGQKETIQLHIPYFLNSAQEVVYKWYHEGLNLFLKSCPAGYAIYEKFETEINAQIQQVDGEQFERLIDSTAQYRQKTEEELENGRSALLELNSCNATHASDLIDQIYSEEQSGQLTQYMEQLFDRYGLDYEEHSPKTLILRPTDHMKTDHFPGIHNEALTVTFSREKALKREDFAFLTWEHPLVIGAMDMVLTSEFGNTTVATMKIKGLPAGTLLMESWFTVEVIADKSLQLDRFLPLTPVRYLVDPSGRALSSVVSHQQLNDLCQPIKRRIAQQVLQQARKEVDLMLEHSEKMAEKSVPALRQQATDQLTSTLFIEIDRLKALKEVNPDVRQEEIEYLETRLAESKKAVDASSIVLQAARVMVVAG